MRGDERRGEEEEAEEGEAVMPSLCYRGRFYVTFCVLDCPTARKEQEKEGRKGDDASERKRSSERVLI